MSKADEVTHRDARAPARSAGAQDTSSDVPMYELVRTLESDRLMEAHRARTIAIALLFGSVCVALSALWTVYSLLPYLDDTTYVLFEVEKSTGIVRVAQELDAPFTPDERVRQYFITQLVTYMETFDRPDVDRMANVLRHFVTAPLLERYVGHMRSLNDTLGRTRRLVSVDSILPITTHKNAQSLNQSTVDIRVTLEQSDGTQEVQHMVAIVTYRFVPYSKAELESTDTDMRDKIQKNPLGMEVSEYRVDAKLPTLNTTH